MMCMPMSRSDKLLACRPSINFDSAKKSTPEEDFQNRVLRPILKFQNDILISIFISLCESYKINFGKLTSYRSCAYPPTSLGLPLNKTSPAFNYNPARRIKIISLHIHTTIHLKSLTSPVVLICILIVL